MTETRTPKPHYYTSKFPQFLQDSYESDKATITKELDEELLLYTQPGHPDIDKLIARTTSKLEVAHKSFRVSKEKREIYSTILLRLVFEENSSTYQKLVLLKEFNSISGRKKMKHLQLNWQPFYQMLEDNFFKVSWEVNAARGFIDRVFEELLKFLNRGRMYFGEEGLDGVFEILRMNICPSDVKLTKALAYLKLFLHASKKFKPGYYDRWFKELFEIWGWKYNTFWDRIFLDLFSRLAKEHLEIDWSPYYDFLFTCFFKTIKNDLPKKNFNQVDNALEFNPKISYLFKNLQAGDYVTSFIVSMIRSKKYAHSNRFWEHLERLINLTQNFIHPQNHGAWSVSLAQFYDRISREYIKRYYSEKKKRYRKDRDDKKAEKNKMDIESGDKNLVVGEEPLKKTIVNEEERQIEELVMEDADEDEEENAGEKHEEENGEAKSNGNGVDKKDNIEENFLDEECHQKFMEIMTNALNYLVYSSDDTVNHSVAKICRRMMYFRPKTIAPFILDRIYQILDRIDVSHIGVLKIIAFISNPLLMRSNYRTGIYELPKILEKTIDHLTPSDPKKTEVILEVYEKIFSLVPIFDTGDLRKKLKESGSKIALEEIMNKGESHDMVKLTEDLSNWARKYFDKLVDILPHIEKNKVKDEKSYRVLMINPKNKFHSIINQSSESLLEFYLERMIEFLKDNVDKSPNKNVSDIIQALNLTNPHLTIRKILPVLKGKILLKKSKPATTLNEADPLQQLILNSQTKDTTFNYELKVNKDSIIWYLSLVEDCVGFCQDAILEHKDDIEHILFTCLLHDENTVFEKAAQVFQKLIMSLLNIYPTNLGSLNPSDYQDKEKLLTYYSRIGEIPRKNIELTWHQPSEKEIEYVIYLVDLLVVKNAKWLKENFVSKYKENYVLDEKTLNHFVDMMHLAPVEVSITQKRDVYRVINLITQVFGAVNQRCSFHDIMKFSAIEASFDSKFAIKAFNHLRIEMLELLESVVPGLLKSGLANDLNIMKTLVHLIGDICGEDDHNDYMLNTNTFLKSYHKAFSIPWRRNIDNRFILATKINLEVQKRIYSFNFGISFGARMESVHKLLWIFAFHSQEKVATKATSLLDKVLINSEDRLECLNKVYELTIRSNSTKFRAIRDQAKQLEETGEITLYEGTKLRKANKDSYQESILKGYSRILELALNCNLLIKNPEVILQALKSLAESYIYDDEKLQNKIILQLLKFLKGLDLMQIAELRKKSTPTTETEKKPVSIFVKRSPAYEEFVQKYNQIEVNDIQNGVIHLLESTSGYFTRLAQFTIDTLKDEKSPWKLKTVFIVFGNLLGCVLDANSNESKELIKIFISLIDDTHYFLRQFTIASLPILLRLNLNRKFPRGNRIIKRSTDDFANMRKTFDEVIKTHFILPEDSEKIRINDPTLGFYETYKELKVDHVLDYESGDIIDKDDHVNNVMLTKEFMERLIGRMVNDLSVKEDGGQQNHSASIIGGSVQELASNMQLLLITIFSKGKFSGHSSRTSLYQYIVARFFKRLFHNYGLKAFKVTIDIVEPLVQDLNSREKQGLAINYFSGLLKAVRFWSLDARTEAMDRVAKLFIHATNNVSLEIFQSWMTAFTNSMKVCDYRVFEPLFKHVLKNPFESKTTNIQGRYIAIYCTVMKVHGYHTRHLAVQLATEILKVDPSDMRQASEIGMAMIPCLKTAIGPLSYRKIKEESIVPDIDEVINKQKDRFLLSNNLMLFEVDPFFKSVLDHFVDMNKKSDTPEKRKINIQTIVNSLFILQKDTLGAAIFKYYYEIIAYLIELNLDEHTLDADAQKTYRSAVGYLSKAMYSKEGIEALLPVIERCLNHANFRVRENGLAFYEFFFFNHIYHIDKPENVLLYHGLADENNNVRNAAFNGLVDVFKIFTTQEIKSIATKMTANLENKDTSEKDRTQAIMMLMALVLSFPYEIESWMEDVLKVILKHKKLSKIVQERIKDFFSRFWKTHKQSWNLNNIKLSEDVLDRIKEISNPYSYFA